MHEVTLALAVLLTVGFVAAKLGHLVRLPSVTGYICAGLLLGPSGFDLLSVSVLHDQLGHFTQIALMLIAFGIGEHLELNRVRHTVRVLLITSFLEIATTFLFVFAGFFLLAPFLNLDETLLQGGLVSALLLAAISVTTSPDSTLHVIKENKAAGPLTTTLAQLVAVNNGSSIILFGFAMAIGKFLINTGQTTSVTFSLLKSLGEVALSLGLGFGTGLVIDGIIQRLKNKGEMLTVGLALLLLGGELARLLSLSSLLTGMAIGFTIVNRDRRDVRIFRLLNNFEPPIYVLFFTIAGAHLDPTHLATTGWLGSFYFLLRVFGKFSGATIGSIMSGIAPGIRKYLGITLFPQAGMAIGFSFLLSYDSSFSGFAHLITSIVLVGAFWAEFIGPLCTKLALIKANEAAPDQVLDNIYAPDSTTGKGPATAEISAACQKLTAPQSVSGSVLFGVSQKQTAGSLARLATILAHYHQATPCALLIKPQLPQIATHTTPDDKDLFSLAEKEVCALGYQLSCEKIMAESVAEGLLAGAEKYKARAIIMGYPLEHSESQYAQVIDQVARQAECDVIIARLVGIRHNEKILVPIIHGWNIDVIESCLCSLVNVGQHRVTLLRLLPPDATEDSVQSEEQNLQAWAAGRNIPFADCRTRKVDSRLEEIIEEAGHHDLVIMATEENIKLHKILFGALADDVARQCSRPTIVIHSKARRKNAVGEK